LRRRMAIALVLIFLVPATFSQSADATTARGSVDAVTVGTEMVWPAAGDVLGHWTLDPATSRGHRGIDIAPGPGSAVVAVLPGEVSFVGYTPAEGGGMTIAIDHGRGLRSTYLHLAGITVETGDTVAAGESLGTSDGRPLHLGLKYMPPGGNSYTYLDPERYLPERAHEENAPAAPAAGAEGPGGDASPVLPPAEDGSVPPPVGESPGAAAAAAVLTEPSPATDITAIDPGSPVITGVTNAAPDGDPAMQGSAVESILPAPNGDLAGEHGSFAPAVVDTIDIIVTALRRSSAPLMAPLGDPVPSASAGPRLFATIGRSFSHSLNALMAVLVTTCFLLSQVRQGRMEPSPASRGATRARGTAAASIRLAQERLIV